MAQDTISILKILSPKKALINGKSSEYKKRFLKIFEEDLFCCPGKVVMFDERDVTCSLSWLS